MEAHLTGASSDKLLEGLSFSPPNSTASYVTETKYSNFFAESGNTFDSLSSKVIRFRVADQGFLESASLRLRFTIVNLKNEALTPCASPMAMFRRARLFAASQLVEDLTLLPNQTTLRDRMLPMERRVNNSIEANPMDNNEASMEIGSQASRRVIAPLPVGTVNQPSWLPMHLISGGMVIELELDEKMLRLQKRRQTGFFKTSLSLQRYTQLTPRWPIRTRAMCFRAIHFTCTTPQ